MIEEQESDPLHDLRAENEALKTRVALLTKLLQEQGNEKIFADACVQTEQVDESDNDGSIEILDDVSTPWSAPHSAAIPGCSNTANGQISIADMVRSAAEQTVTEQSLPGFVFCPNSGMYFNQESGYYYDPHSTLFYHSSTQQYYYYDQAANEYKVYGQAAASSSTPSAPSASSKYSSRKYRKLAQRYQPPEDVETGAFECVMDMLDRLSFFVDGRRPKRTYMALMGEGSHPNSNDDPHIMSELIDLTEDDDAIDAVGDANSSDEDEEMREMMRRREQEEEANRHPPCIRLMEMPNNTLHIVTISGAVLGRMTGCDVQLSGENIESVSRTHSKITYDADRRRYYVEDMNSKYGTFVNHEKTMKKTRLQHGDKLQVGSKTLSVHLHQGSNTCAGCEQGLYVVPQASASAVEPAMTRTAKERMRKKETKLLKKQCGLVGEDYVKEQRETHKELKTQYKDRASERRQLYGSEHDAHGRRFVPAPLPTVLPAVQSASQGPAPANVNKALSSDNKGFKMLSKMGWKEGKGIGKTDQGIAEPIPHEVRVNRSGLGAEEKKHEAPKTAKERMWLATQKRYAQAQSAKPLFDSEVQELKTFTKSTE
uniref:Angiogenic factor with G patch and FHA domains 1 n=1 Tax=Plectus sambesii TaxID=2011161 RepID=A0A914VQB5_9BILA